MHSFFYGVHASHRIKGKHVVSSESVSGVTVEWRVGIGVEKKVYDGAGNAF